MNYRRLGANYGLGYEKLKRMETHLSARLSRMRRGAPFRRAARFMLLVARLFAVAHVTLWRYCNLVIGFFSSMFETPSGVKELIVDTTSTRVRGLEL